jgi:hypothetical protein
LEEIVEEVRKEIGIPVYERSVENVISALLSSQDIWEIVELSGEPLPLVAKILEVLERRGYVDLSNGVSLSDEGLKLIETLGIYKREKLFCEVCGGRGLNLKVYDELLKEFSELVFGRPEPRHEFDQAFVTPETVIARVALMHARGDLAGKEIFVLGDDDLMSVALMLSNLPKRIAVLDIDERLIKFIEKIADEIGFQNIDIFVFDLREPLPDYARGKFDSFITDPPETLEAIRAFVGRGIATLKGPGCSGYFGLTRVESSADKWRGIEKILLNEFNVVITDIIKDFNEYTNWGYVESTKAWRLIPVKTTPKHNWYKSSIFRIQTLENSKGFEDELKVGKELYDDEESSTT